MKITVHRQPCLLQEATELVHAFVNQTPVEQLAGNGEFCIPLDEILRIREEACDGLNPDNEELQFFFHGIPFEDKSDGLASIARCMVYSMTDDIIPDVDSTVELMLRSWSKHRSGTRINNISLYGIGFDSGESGEFHSLAKEMAKLPVPVPFQLQLVEAFSNYEHYLHRLVELLRPVTVKLQVLLEPWVSHAMPLVRQWEEYFSSEENIREFFMRNVAFPEITSTELNFALHYLQPKIGFVCFASFYGAANILMGVGQAVGLGDTKAAKESLENCDYMVLRQLANSDRMSMLLAMMAAPMTAQELSRKLELHSGSVFRDLNSMSNSNLLIKEVIGGKQTYRTNYTMLQKLFQKILQSLDKERNP